MELISNTRVIGVTVSKMLVLKVESIDRGINESEVVLLRGRLDERVVIAILIVP